MFEPTNDAIWTTGVVECRPLTEGRLREGSKVERVSKFLGRQFGYLMQVVAGSGDDFVEMRVEEPFPMWIRYELEDAPEGTRASIRTRGDATGFFRLAAPFMGRMVRRSIENDLALLREYLEARSARDE
ncbi:MAG: hypothetical protein M5U28_39080 [Sandaracinaceae bacterium]|nr:hypothetical protein [Sandaracinaceae bacterium]